MLLKIILIALTAAGQAGLSADKAVVETGVGNGPYFELSHYEAVVRSIRQLEFKYKVKYADFDNDELAAFINQRMDEDMPAEKLDNEFTVYKTLGLGEGIEDIRGLLLGLYFEQIAAFYDQRSRLLVTRKDMTAFSDIIFVHELTHALQDQHFSLDKHFERVKDNNDRLMALTALVEGDASLVQTRYMFTQKEWKARDFLAMLGYEQEKIMNVPYFVRQNLLFPYTKGVKFATELFEQGGWEALNRAYRNPPASTEQILHPEKYFPERDDPREIMLPEIGAALGETWSLKSENNFGELNIYILLRKYIGGIWAKKPSRGWGGDWYNYYREADGDQYALVWDTVWDSVRDADEFFKAYRKLVERRFRENRSRRRLEDAGAVLWHYDNAVIFLGRNADEVLVMHFQKPELLQKALEKFPAFDIPKSSCTPIAEDRR